METVRLVLLFVHVLGWAALFGGLVTQSREPAKRVTGAMRDGVGTAFLSGIALVGVIQGADLGDLDNAKIAVKSVVGLVLLVLVMANARKERIPQGLWVGLTLLTVANIAVAVFWSSAHA
jgi:hypothetical protein